eukprot:166872_1
MYSNGFKSETLDLPPKAMISEPSKPMQTLPWKPIELNKIKSSIWNQVDHQWMDYDTLTFEQTFQHKREDNKAAEHKQLLDRNGSEHVRMALQAIPLSIQQIRSAILSLDDSLYNINADTIRSLLDIIPNHDEQIQAKHASEVHGIQHFNATERFFHSLHDIIELKERLHMWLFKLTFEEKVQRIERTITVIETCKRMVTHSTNLKQILSIVLAFGNKMNYGKDDGNAYGFDLTDLAQISHVQSYDKSMTFSMFLCWFLRDKYPHVLDIIHELESIEDAAHIDIDEVNKQCEALEHQMNDLKAMIDRYKNEYKTQLNVDDRFIDVMRTVVVATTHRLCELQIKCDRLYQIETQLLTFFAYDTEEESSSIQNIFEDLSNFIGILKTSDIKLQYLNPKMDEKRANKRRTNTITLSRQPYQSLVAPKAITMEDMGTPVGDQQREHVGFDLFMEKDKQSEIDRFRKKHKKKWKRKGTFDIFKSNAKTVKTSSKTRTRGVQRTRTVMTINLNAEPVANDSNKVFEKSKSRRTKSLPMTPNISDIVLPSSMSKLTPVGEVNQDNV